MKQNIKQEMVQKKKRQKKITAIVIFLIIFGILAWWLGIQVSEWWKARKEYVEMGFASDKFPFRMYTAEELAEKGLYPEALYENVATRTRPEETYAKFRQALIDEDFDTAAECFVKENRKEVREGLENVKKEGFLQEMLNDLPEKLEDTYIYTEHTGEIDLDRNSLTSYYYILPNDPSRDAQTIFFEKNKHGDWLIEGL